MENIDYKVLTKANYYDKAKEIVKTLKKKDEKFILTTTQIRNILSMVNEIYNDVIIEDNADDKFNEKFKARLSKVKTRIIYEIGRDDDPEKPTGVKDFTEKTDLLNMFENAKSKEDFLLFHNYFEALVAFHKFYGGKD